MKHVHEIDMAVVEARVMGQILARRGKSDFSKSNPIPNLFDFHTQKAAEMFGIDPDQVTPEQRRVGKMENFIHAYGGRSADFVIHDECQHLYRFTWHNRLRARWGQFLDWAEKFLARWPL